jgi:hypothetical protein
MLIWKLPAEISGFRRRNARASPQTNAERVKAFGRLIRRRFSMTQSHTIGCTEIPHGFISSVGYARLVADTF